MLDNSEQNVKMTSSYGRWMGLHKNMGYGVMVSTFGLYPRSQVSNTCVPTMRI